MSDARSVAQQAARDEYRRLLYVAMTRAKERLVIAGTQGRNKIADGCWYQLVDDALREACVSEPADDGDGEVLRFRKGPPAEERPRRFRAGQRPRRPPCRTGCAPTQAPSLPACAR